MRALIVSLILMGLVTLPRSAVAEGGQPTISVVESAPYYHGQTIHVVTSPLKGTDIQYVLCGQDSFFAYNVYGESSVYGTYVLDSLEWRPDEIAYCRAFVRARLSNNHVKAEVDFVVYPTP